MATYAIGDVQGYFKSLQALLKIIDFQPMSDQLWFCGDLVNRGPGSLETLRFIKSLQNQTQFSANKTIVTLGNHDLHLLAVFFGAAKARTKDTLKPILQAPDRDDLLNWLLQQPLFHQDASLGFCMVHAGIPPQWSITDCQNFAKEIEAQLQSSKVKAFFQHMYGNEPSGWDNGLSGWERLRLITNYLTRMRFCTPAGKLDFENKGRLEDRPEGYIAWFESPERNQDELKILFGHWAALQGVCEQPNIFALDTGCVWGNQLSALRLDDKTWFRCNNHEDLPKEALIKSERSRL